MIASLIYDSDRKEQQTIQLCMKELAAKLTDENWRIEQASTLEQIELMLQDRPILDMLLYDVTGRNAMDYLHKLRKEYRSAQLMIIADINTSPMEYLKPGILASSLLLRPWSDEQVYCVLKEFVQCCIRSKNEEEIGKTYRIESREGTINIPYEQIYFLEAREKKIFVCAGKEEFGFYSTMDKLTEELPEYFVRCHRSFVVNTQKIRRIILSQNMIYLSDGFEIPLSRSYKSILKGFGKNG